MRSEQETTRIVRDWLDHGVTVLPERVLDRVLDDVATTRQRGVWHAPMGPARLLVAAAVLVAVIIGGVSFAERIGNAIRDPTPDATPIPSVRSLVSIPPGPLEAGPYAIDAGFPVRVEFDVPEGWSKTRLGSDYAVVASQPDGVPARPPSGVILGFYTVANLYADPCDLEGRMVDPPVGQTVDDLVAAFSVLPGYEASVAVPASIDGYSGQRVELDLQLYMCEFGQVEMWETPSGSVRRPAGDDELSTLWIVDVDGERLVVDATAYPITTEEDLDELMAVVESIRIGPADEAP